MSEWLGCGISTLLTAMQTNQTWQIVCLVLTAISIAVTTAFNIWKWVKAAKRDGKITQEELEEGVGILNEGIDKITNLGKEKKEDGTKIQ